MNVYEKINVEIISLMENGVCPWKKSWTIGMPKNFISEKEYRGFNRLFLGFVCSAKEYKSPLFLTFNQAKKLGGQVRKGERGTTIIYWAPVYESDEELNPKKMIPCAHTVFNVSQCDGLNIEPVKNNTDGKASVQECDQIIKNMTNAPQIINGNYNPVYYPTIDKIYLPNIADFTSNTDYYATLFHELTHSTGHPNRLDREIHNNFGTEKYSKEELIAEIGSAFLCEIAGISTNSQLENNAAYLNGWIKAIKGDKTLIVKASQQAQKAVDFILNNHNNKAN